jgi:hypothetical protein
MVNVGLANGKRRGLKMGKVMPTCSKCTSFLNRNGVCLTCNPVTKAKPYKRPELTKKKLHD